MLRGAACVLLLLGPLAAGRALAQDMRVHLLVQGAMTAEVTVAHEQDTAHFCSAAADPWADRDAADLRATPYPFYRLVFGGPAAGAELATPGPSIGLTLSNYFAAAQRHSDKVNDSIELVLDGRHFVGHAELRDPAYSLDATYREDRRGGRFTARALHETGDGGATLDVEGAWECPPVAADRAEQQVGVHLLFAGAQPAHGDPPPLRLSRSDIPCIERGCAGWRVTDEATGFAYLARVDFARLRLAPRLRQQAKDGQVDLLVHGEVRAGNPPLVVPILLDGVTPAAAPSEEAALP